MNFAVLAAVFGIYAVQGQDFTYSLQAYNYAYLLELYTLSNVSVVDFLPVVNHTTPLEITVDMKLNAINDFDEVGGSMELAGSLYMSWRDEVRNITGGKYGFIYTGKQTMLVPNDKVWTPRLVLANAVDGVSAVGDPAYMCRYNMNTTDVIWNPRILIKGACSPDVTYYPFDRQSCVFTYIPWGYWSNEILLIANSSTWDLSLFEPNGVWEVVETKSEALIKDSTSNLKLSLVVERKPLYFAFNIILPVLVLCVLNTMVFWLPAESGERVGFSVTCFLSFVVLLNMVMGILPRSSSPISFLCFYLVAMMIFSGLVSTFVIIEMVIYHKPETEKVPQWLQKFMRVITCRSCRCRSNDVRDVKNNENAVNGTNTVEVAPADGQMDGEENDEPEEITWPVVGRVLDRFFFCACLGLELFFSITFLLPLATRA